MKRLMLGGALAIVALACSPQPEGSVGAQGGAATSPVTVALPEGSPEAGRQAFLDLKCTTCHAVPSEPEFPAPLSGNRGPAIDARLAERDLSYLATAIASPSHEFSVETSAEVRASIEGTLSPMGDFSQVMTVRQLVDLNAYLRSIKE